MTAFDVDAYRLSDQHLKVAYEARVLLGCV